MDMYSTAHNDVRIVFGHQGSSKINLGLDKECQTVGRPNIRVGTLGLGLSLPGAAFPILLTGFTEASYTPQA